MIGRAVWVGLGGCGQDGLVGLYSWAVMVSNLGGFGLDGRFG